MQECAKEALDELEDAQRAELKAMHGAHRKPLQHLRDTEAERIADTKAAINDAYREDTRDLFKRQSEEVQPVKDMTATKGGRIKALLSGRAGDAFDYENRGTLAGASP